jgi:four helix bundle protein
VGREAGMRASGNPIESFEDLEVWQRGKDLVLSVYGVVRSFPSDELFGLTAQVKRSALSVPANIAEGFGRYHYMDKAKFYLNARGSLYELKSHLIIAEELGFTNGMSSGCGPIMDAIERLAVQLNNLIAATRQKAGKSVQKSP